MANFNQTSTLGWATGSDQRNLPSLSMSPLSSKVSQTADTYKKSKSEIKFYFQTMSLNFTLIWQFLKM